MSSGRLSSHALSLASRDVEVRGAGSLVLASQSLEMKGTLTLSEALTALAGDMLTRLAAGGSGRIELPATVTGTLQTPRPRVDAAALIKQGIRNEVNVLAAGRGARPTYPFVPPWRHVRPLAVR